MRVAFFVSSFPELSETFILRQVVGLLRRGHEVRIFATAPSSGGPTHEAVDAYDLQSLVRVLPGRRHSVTPSGTLKIGDAAPAIPPARTAIPPLSCLRPRYARAIGSLPLLARTLGALSAEEPFDVVHCHYGEVGLRYGVAARLWGAPLVVSFYGYDSSLFPLQRGRRVYEPMFWEADAVTTLSGHMDRQLRELGCPDRLLHRVPLAVDSAIDAPRQRAPGRAGEPVRLLTVARLAEKKGIEFGLRALAMVADEFPQVRYDVIGEGPLRPELEALASALGIQDRVRLLGAQTTEQVRDALHDADVFVLPSVTAENGDQEGTPTAVLEAAFCRLPVVSTHHAGIPEIVRDGESGVLVPERDPGALAQALRSVLRSPERWTAMGEAGRQIVEPAHSMDAVAERLERLYADLATPGAAVRPAAATSR